MDNSDQSESVRKTMIDIGLPEEALKQCQQSGGKVYAGRDELLVDFEIIGFLAPFVCVIRKSDGVKGSLMFTHMPRFYFNFEAT